MGVEDVTKFMSAPPARPERRTPGQIVVDAMREYVRLKEQVMPCTEGDEARDAVRDVMQDLRGVVSEYMGVPYSARHVRRYGVDGIVEVADDVEG